VSCFTFKNNVNPNAPLRFQPETLRPIVESNKFDELSFVYKPIIPVIGQKARSRNAIYSHTKVPKNPFRLFLNIDVDILLATSAVVCAVFYGVVATISSLFVTTYPLLNQTTIGLCFLAIGGGMTIGSTINGRVLDSEYQRFKRRIEDSRLVPEKEGVTADISREENFPLEKVCSQTRYVQCYISYNILILFGHSLNIIV